MRKASFTVGIDGSAENSPARSRNRELEIVLTQVKLTGRGAHIDSLEWDLPGTLQQDTDLVHAESRAFATQAGIDKVNGQLTVGTLQPDLIGPNDLREPLASRLFLTDDDPLVDRFLLALDNALLPGSLEPQLDVQARFRRRGHGQGG